MSATEKLLDPICDMIVDVAEAEDAGLTLEHERRIYAFCSAGCQVKFAKNPNAYIDKVATWRAQPHDAKHEHAGEMPTIDEGMRHWYASCRCCLSDAYPAVVTMLDAEREAAKQAPAAAGICETAEQAH
jgi:YHS domain-containing protein